MSQVPLLSSTFSRATARPRSGKRRWLAATALGGMAGLMIAAGAQAYPSNTSPTIQVSAGGSPPSIPVVAPPAGTGEMDIVLGAPRTILTWNNFNLAAGETVNFVFDANNWIVLNRVNGGQMSLNGQINGIVDGAPGGNVWFSAPNGVIFGPNARVNVGGLLATTTPLASDTAFLTPTEYTIDFAGGPGVLGGITVQGGARLTGNGGTLALVGLQVNTDAGSQIGGDADVFYGAARNFSVGFLPTDGDDLSLLNFVVPTGGGTTSPTPLRLSGATLANNVIVAHVSRADVLNAVIDAPGLIVAQAASEEGGNVILSSGIDIGGGVVASPSAGGVAALTADFGQVIAARDIRIQMRGPAAQTAFFADSLAAGGSVESYSGQFTIQTGIGQTLSAGSYVFIDAPNGIATQAIGAVGDVSLYATQDGTSDTVGTGVINLGAVTAGGAIFAAGQRVLSPSLASGESIGVLTSSNTATATPIIVGDLLARTGIDLAATNGSIMLERVTLTGVDVTDPGEPHFFANASAVNGDVLFGVTGPGSLTGPVFGYTAAISAGRDALINLTGPATFQSIEAGRDVSAVTTGALAVGFASAGRDLRLTGTTVDLDEVGGTLSRDITITATAGGFITPGDMTAGRDLRISATGDVVTTNLRAQAGLISVGGSTVTAGSFTSGTTTDVVSPGAVSATSVSAGGSVRFSGSTVDTQAINSGGGVDVTGTSTVTLASITATGSVRASGVNTSSGAIVSGGSTEVIGTTAVNLSSIVAGGSVRIAGGPIVVNQNIQSGSTFDVSSNGAVSLNGVTAPGAVTMGTGTFTASSIAGGSTVTLFASGPASIGTLTSTGLTRLVALDLNIGTSLTASSLVVESLNGNLRIGGPAGASPAGTMVIDNTEFQRIRVTNEASFYAGSVANTNRGTLTAQDLSIDPSRVPRLNLLAGTNNDVLVTGAVAPTASGGVLVIGSQAASTGWQPRRILVSGSIGAATGSPQTGFTGVRAFNSLSLLATNDIIIGSQRFIDLIIPTPASNIDIARGLPAGSAATGDEVGRVYLASSVLGLSAGDRIVQQNTGTTAAQNGLYLANSLTGQRQDTVLTLGSTPLVDLFGGFVDQAGVLQTGLQAALAPELRRPSGSPFSRTVRFNGCSIGSAAGCVVSGGPETTFRLEDYLFGRPDQLTDQALLSTAPDAEDEDETDPVITGAGNEEIWRSRK